MSIVVKAAPLDRALALVAKIAPRRPNMAILSNLLIEAADGLMRITATDLELWLTVELPAVGTGRLLLPADALTTLVKRLPRGADLAIEPGAGRIDLKSGRIRTHFGALDARDFPAPKTPAWDPAVIQAADWANALKRALPAASTEPTRFYLNGIYVESTAEGVTFTATDGCVLCTLATTMAGPEGSMILPREAVPHLVQVLGTASTAELAIADGSYRIVADGELRATLQGRLIDGTFPDYRRIIPNPTPDRIRVGGALFAGALGRAQIVSDLKEGPVVSLSAQGEALTVEAFTGAGADGYVEEIEASAIGTPTPLMAKVKYLTGALDALEADQVELHVRGDRDAVLCCAADAGPGHQVRYVLMPFGRGAGPTGAEAAA